MLRNPPDHVRSGVAESRATGPALYPTWGKIKDHERKCAQAIGKGHESSIGFILYKLVFGVGILDDWHCREGKVVCKIYGELVWNAC